MKKKNKIFISNATYNEIKYAKGKGEWFELSSPEIVKNYSTGEYIHKKSNVFSSLVLGIAGLIGDTVIIGYFQLSEKFQIYMLFKEEEFEGYKGFITLPDYNKKIISMPVISSAIADKIGTNFILNTVSNTYLSHELNKEVGKNKNLVNIIDNKLKFHEIYGYPYSLADHSSFLIKEVIENVKQVISDKITMNKKKLYKLISPFSFGLEIETSSGAIPDRYVWETGFIPLRDGSIGAHEYVSVPFFNEIGFKAMEDIGNVTIRNCNINKFCSFHVHLGNFSLTKKETIAFYKLCFRIQQELFDFVPPYKRDETYFAAKTQGNGQAKDHCKPLRGLHLTPNMSEDEKYNKIVNFVTPPGYNNGAQKWNKKSRYFWVNLLPFMTNGKTIEFRLHEPTLNYQKMILWLLICAAIIKYSKKNVNSILKEDTKIMLTDIFSVYEDTEYGKKISSFLIDYINYRTENFMNLFAIGGYADESFLSGDKEFKYEEKKFRELFI